ncbi:5-formyltetrahydrofolate cyclo-ligase [Vibrio diazotrophicus]|uniref:5-formyltetrahydrofolate cyclo-ligase n=1 Tax=Vibrio diazotrophicus TaxID=685 RepID=A0A329EBD5_VIBDI|nr:5-formyltetrahydrofolate cyclo-ligase [Vibrio diazotrophicus]PNI01871.1 5-formyltetrahydrofolate cyclo-ligase [Vibrio diazotrophicus]RAS66467.1 5-formyltetrahydrofolate cyclo-ligase [Vibrio diazotrophicus]
MLYSRQELRTLIREKRNQLASDVQFQASQDLIERFSTLPEMRTCQKIALYLSTDGELDTQPLIEWLWSQGKSIYLPVLHPFSAGHLLFLHYQPETPMTYNKFGILEPKLNQTLICPVKELDLICTPLVAFDSQGHRLGMGGGYYDRTLEPWFNTGKGASPLGLAHDCQHVEQLPTEEWDVPLPKIVTPSQIWQW